MSNFDYHSGVLHAEGVSLIDIADQYGTPAYIYSRKTIESNWEELDIALTKFNHLVCYAVKANSNIAVLNLLAKIGSGFDIVSKGELQRVIKAGGDPANVVFSGVGKSTDEVKFALEQNIKCFNVESESELVRINSIASELDVQAAVSLRVNPDVDAETHPYISTGLKENKFGIAFDSARDIYQQAAAMQNINVVGIDCHIGSQLINLAPFEDAFNRISGLIEELKQLGIELKHIDIGGGIGIVYQDETPPSIDQYIEIISNTLAQHDLEIIIEPGRSIVGNAGILLTRVEYLKTTPEHNFAVVDAAMNDLIRPALYSGWHDIKRVIEASNAEELFYDVVGPVCETADFLGKGRKLKLEQDDLLATFSAGAYGFTMASNYNSRPRVVELLVDGNQIHEIRKRESIEDLMQGESLIS